MYKEAILLSGPIIGFSAFLYETTQIENVYFRKNSKNEKVFKPLGLVEFLVAPLAINKEKAKTVWAMYPNLSLKDRIQFLRMNWVVSTTTGLLVSGLIYTLL